VSALRIACRIQQRDWPRPGAFAQRFEPARLFGELAAVAPDKLRPALRVLMKPNAQLRAGCEILGPGADATVLFADPTWPKSIHEDTKPVEALCRIVDPLYPNAQGAMR